MDESKTASKTGPGFLHAAILVLLVATPLAVLVVDHFDTLERRIKALQEDLVETRNRGLADHETLKDILRPRSSGMASLNGGPL